MKKETILAYVYDFVECLLETGLQKEIKRIILFGSVARGTFDKKSDVDLFIELLNPAKKDMFNNTLKSVLRSFEEKAEHTWQLKGVKLPITCVIGSLDEPRWKELKEELISTGLCIYDKFEMLPKKLKHYFMISYSLKKLLKKDQMKLIRRLFGYNTFKKKEYKHAGLLKETGGMKLGTNTILVRSDIIKDFRKLFAKFKVKINIREAWLRD